MADSQEIVNRFLGSRVHQLTADYRRKSHLNRLAFCRGGGGFSEAMMLETECYQCPYCGEQVEALLDLSAGEQCYYEDCPVCCRPILFQLWTDGQSWQLQVRREDD